MALVTGIDKARERTMSTGGNGQAAFWLEVGSRVVLKSQWSCAGRGGGLGDGGWQRCGVSACLGSAIGPSGECYIHASGAEQNAHAKEVRAGRKTLDLRGTEIKYIEWAEILANFEDDVGAIAVPISCSGALFTERIRMEEHAFKRGIGFLGAIFEAGLYVQKCTFERELDIRFASFVSGPAGFHNCKISTLHASFCNTQQSVGFISCELTGEVSAEGVQRDFRFENCHLRGLCDMSGADVDALILKGSRFDGGLRMCDVNAKNLYCPDIEVSTATTIGPLNASGADMSNSTFERQARLIVKTPTLNLSGSAFNGGGRIECKEAKVDLSGLVVGSPLLIIGADGAAVLSIQDADCGHLRLSSLDLSDCHFYGCHDLQGIILESTVSLPNPPKPLRARRKCVADEFAWRSANTRWRKSDWSRQRNDEPRRALGTASINSGGLAVAQIADVYRALRTSVEGRSNEPGAADFYYGEMEMRRLDRATSRWDRMILWAYWLISGYGLRALRSIFCLLCVFMVGSVLMREFGLRKNLSWPTAFVASGQSVIPGLSVNADLTSNGQAVEIFLRIVGPVLFGLGALALRNRVRR